MNLAALRSSDFLTYLAGNFFALNAMWALRIIVGWLAWNETHSASFVGLIAFFYFFPSLILGPFFGVVTDRSDLRRSARVNQSLFFASAMGLWLVQELHLLAPPHLVVYALATGLVSAAHSPVRMSLAPRLVSPSTISSAVNFASINYNVCRMTGPALGGWAISQFGTGPSTLMAALCYIPFLLALFWLNVRPQKPRSSRPDFGRDLIDGFRIALGNPGIRAALGLSAVTALLMLGTLEILPVIADGVFARGASGLGNLTASGGFGALAAGLLLAIIPSVHGTRWLRVASGVGILGAVCIVWLSQTQVWAVAVGLVAVMAGTASAAGIICQSAIQMQIDDTMRGRVMSVWASVAIGGSALGAAVLGGLVELFGLGPTLATAAIGAISILVVVFWQAAGLRPR